MRSLSVTATITAETITKHTRTAFETQHVNIQQTKRREQYDPAAYSVCRFTRPVNELAGSDVTALDDISLQ